MGEKKNLVESIGIINKISKKKKKLSSLIKSQHHHQLEVHQASEKGVNLRGAFALLCRESFFI